LVKSSPMKVFLIDADNLPSAAWIEEARNVPEATEGTLAVRRTYDCAKNLKGLAQAMQAWATCPYVNLSLANLPM